MVRSIFFILSIAVGFSCFSQKIENVVITGNKKTKTQFISKLIVVSKNTILDSTRLERDINLLKRLPGIADAYYEVKDKSNTNYEVIYHLEENFSVIPSLSVYTTNDGEFAYRAGLYEFNGLGRGYQVGGFFQRDIFNSYAFLFKAPFLISSKMGIALTHQNLTTLEPLYFTSGTANYKYNNVSYELMLLYRPFLHHRFELGANYFTENYTYVEGMIDGEIPPELTVDKTLFKIRYEFNNTRTKYQFISGVRNQLRFQYVEEVNSVSPAFFIAINDLHFYKQLGQNGTWASRFRIGFATNNDSPFAPFALDNNINIRGVGNTIDRGTASLVLNTEYRYTLFEKNWFVLQSNAFIDMGTWRQPGGTLNDFTKKDNIKLYPGIGIRVMHKKIYNTVFRIDYGVGIMKGSTHGMVFGIGQYF